MTWLWVLGAAIAIGLAGWLGRILLQQNRPGGGGGGQVLRNHFGVITIPCDGSAREYEYRRNPSTTVYIRVVRTCAGCKLEYQDRNGTWVEPQDSTGEGVVGPIEPQTNATYIFTVPNGRRIRITCNDATAEGTCEFELINGSQQPNGNVALNPEVTITCNQDEEAKVYNFGTGGARVEVVWTDVCKNRNAAGAHVGQKPAIRFRTMGQVPAVYTQPGPAEPVRHAAGANTASWKGNVPNNASLEVKCPGTIAGCKFRVRYTR